MIQDSCIDKITSFHRACLEAVDWPHEGSENQNSNSLWNAIKENHKNNCLLWAEEDLARRRLASDKEIAMNKRNIDRYNQARNNAIEAIDEHLLAWAMGQPQFSEAKAMNSESAGSIVDRLSILSLKKFAFEKQIERTDTEESHKNICKEKLFQLTRQEQDLKLCYSMLIEDAKNGTVRWKIYRQFKMYNDPNLNPQIYLEIPNQADK